MSILRYIPNMLTLLRMILTIIYLVLLNKIQFNSGHRLNIIYAALVFTLICATDFLDGKIARKIKVESKLGSILDVIADFIFIVSSLCVLNFNSKIPIWFIGLVLIKFIEFIVTSYIIRITNDHREGIFIFDYLGRISAANFFIVPGMILLTYIGIDIKYINIFIYITTVLVIISSSERCLNCYRLLKRKKIIDVCNNVLDN